MTPETPTALDLQENIRIAQGLIRSLSEQEAEVQLAYARGWRECGEVLAGDAAAMWEAGYDAAIADRLDDWKTFSDWYRNRHGSDLNAFEERRAAELAAVTHRPNDFPGVERDPQCIERCRESVESITRNVHQRAA
jgi:hypothetical protein